MKWGEEVISESRPDHDLGVLDHLFGLSFLTGKIINQTESPVRSWGEIFGNAKLSRQMCKPVLEEM